MKSNQSATRSVVWSKEDCAEVVKKCKSKEEVQKNYPDIHTSIIDNKWFYLYGVKYLGTAIQPIIDELPPAPVEIDVNPLKLKATNAIEAPVSKPKRKKPVAKVYKLTKYQPLSFTLNVGRNKKLLVWDPLTERSRAIRHCPNEKTIFLDDQSKEISVVEPIVFIKGFLNTTEKEGYTQEFLEIHPKFNLLFELVNAEADAHELVSMEDLIIDIKQVIREKSKEEGGIEELRAVVSVLNSDPGGAAKMTASELRFAAYESVNTNPNRFIDDDKNITIFDDADIKRTAIAQHAFLAGIIQVSPNGRQVIWGDNKSPICNVPAGLNYMKVFSEFLSTEEGINVSVELTKR